MKRSDHTEEKLDPEVERELEAVERALAGLPVEDEMAPIAGLVAEIRAERPEPEPGFASRLDRRAAAGFGGAGSSPLASRIAGIRLRTLMPAMGAVATLAIVAAIGIGVTSDDRGDGTSGSDAAVVQSADAPAAGTSDSADSGVATTFDSNGQMIPAPEGGIADSAEAGALEDASPDFRQVEPLVAGKTVDAAGSAAYPASGDKVAPGRDKRQQDRSAYLKLKTDTNKVRDVSDEAIQITESSGGIVTSSQLSEEGNTATASLDLSIPSRSLDATLDQLTDLATVASYDESSVDITQPFVSAQDELADAKAKREKLLEALANADSDTEAAAIQQQIDIARQQISQAEAEFDNIARKARMAQVSLRIEGTPNGDDDGSWSLGDAADDSLSALKTVAGVMLVGAAIVLPIVALIALVTWLTIVSRRRGREKALDE